MYLVNKYFFQSKCISYFKKIIKYPRRWKIPDFLLWLLTFFMNWSKIPHRRSLRVASQQAGWFTPTKLSWVTPSLLLRGAEHLRWNWNYRVLILVLVLLFASSLVLCTHVVLPRMGSCPGVSVGNTLPLEGRGRRGGRCSRLPPAYSHCLRRGQEQLRQVMVHCISPPPSRSVRTWCLLCECLKQVL